MNDLQDYRMGYNEVPERMEQYEPMDRRQASNEDEEYERIFKTTSVAEVAATIGSTSAELINDYNHYTGFQQDVNPYKQPATKGSTNKMSSSVFTNDSIEKVVEELKQLKVELKKLENKEERLKQALYNHMLDNEVLITHDGEIKATWSYAKPTTFFDAKKLEKENPHIYNSFLGVREGSRRLLLK